MTPTAELQSDLAQGFFDANVESSLLLGTARELISAAAPSSRVTHLTDGTPVLCRGGLPFAGPSDEQALAETVKGAGQAATFVVFGLGMGHTVRHLRALTRAPIVVFEPDPGNVRTAFESGPTDLGNVPIACTNHDLIQVWTKLTHTTQSAVLVHTPGYAELYSAEAQKLAATLAELVQRRGVNTATHRLRARVWIQDVLENLELLRDNPCFLALAGQYRGVPAFIVGAGPSLGKNGQLLAQAAQKGIVIAVNSSARALASYGVEPQVLACMESIDVSHLLAEVPYIDRVVRAFGLTGHPASLRTGQGPLLPVYESIPQVNVGLQALLGHPGLPVAGSVSTLAFSLAERLGCSPIVLVGQDLAYTDGRAYAAATPYHESRVNLSADGTHIEFDWCETLKRTHNTGHMRMHEREPLTRVEAYGGSGSVVSSVAFSAVRSWFETASKVLAQERPETRLVNATEGGARIAGFQELALGAVLEGLPERSITSRSLAEAAERAAQRPSRERLIDFCTDQRARLDAVRSAARRVRRLAVASRSALDKSNAARVSQYFAKLDVAERSLRAAAQRVPLVDAWAYAEVDGAFKPDADGAVPSDHAEQARRAIEAEERLSLAIERSALDLDKAFVRVIERLEHAS